MNEQNILSFQDLVAWQASHELCLVIFKKSLRNGNLRDQVERSSLSVCSNIAEDFGRSSQKDKEHFYVMARGSLYEVQSQLLLAKNLSLLSEEEFAKIFVLSTKSIKLLHGLIKSTRKT